MSIFAATCLHPEVWVRFGTVRCTICRAVLDELEPRPLPARPGRACGCRADPIVFGHDCRKEVAGG